MENLIKLIGLRVFAVGIVAVMAFFGYLAYVDKISWEVIVQIELFILAFGIGVFWFVNVTFVALRNILKYLIVSEYEIAKERHKISYMKMETCERMYHIYRKLRGNTFVENIMVKMRNFDNDGDAI